MLNSLPYIKNLDSNNFFLLSGPCVVESEEIVFETAQRIKEITDRLKIPFIFKASYRKANRSRLDTNLAFFIYPSNRRFGGAYFLQKTY